MGTEHVGVAFVGAGLVAKLHGRAVDACRAARFVGVHDVLSERAEEIAHQHGGKAYRSFEELLADDAVDAVHVLTPPAGHVPVTLAALEAGKHVLLEKPVADKPADVRRMAAAARARNRILMPAHNYIYVPSLEQGKRLIDEGKLGTVASFWMLFNLFHPAELVEKYGSIYRVACTHHAYSLLYLLGRPIRLMSMGLPGVHVPNSPHVAQAAITCEMPGGAIANLWASFSGKDLTNDPWQVVYKVLGTNGGFSYSWNEAHYEEQGGPGFGMPGYVDSFRTEVDHFINGCILGGLPPRSTMQDALDALKIIEAAEASSRTRAAVNVAYEDVYNEPPP